MGSIPAAHTLVQAFRNRSTGTVVWHNCQRAQVASELDVRIDNPEKIDQNDTQWCGYASILNRVIKSDPEKYANYVVGLFENGTAKLNLAEKGEGAQVSVDDSITKGAPPTILDSNGALVERMPQADYIALAGLRNHFKTGAASVAEKIPILNLLKDIHGSGGGELCNALKTLGCSQVYDQSSAFSSKDMGVLNAASGHFTANRHVILLIDASLIAMGKGNQGRGNHWVVLDSAVRVTPAASGNRDQDILEFEVFSWGDRKQIRETKHVVLMRFFGYVVGYP